MKVIKEGKLKIAKCKRCLSVIQFTKEEQSTIHVSKKFDQAYIKCPVCGNLIGVSL